MRLKITVLLLLAAVLAFGAGLTSFMYFGQVNAELRANRAALAAFGEAETVPVLRRDIAAGETLQPEDFVDLTVPRSYLPANAMTIRPALSEGEVLVALADLGQKQLLLVHTLGRRSPDQPADAPVRLSEGQSATAFAISNLAELRPALVRGDKVDLFVYQAAPGQPVVRLVAEAMEVLHLPVETEAQQGLQPVVGVKPAKMLLAGAHEQIARAMLAAESGELHVARSSGARPAEAGVVLVGAAEMAGLPIAMRAMSGAAPVPGGVQLLPANPQPAGAEGLPVVASGFGLGSDRSCSTSVIRASQRMVIDVPC